MIDKRKTTNKNNQLSSSENLDISNELKTEDKEEIRKDILEEEPPQQ